MIWFSNEKYPELKRQRDAVIKTAQKDKTGKKKIPEFVSLGKDLWYNQFCDPKYICEDWMFDLIEEVNLSMQMEIPIVSNLQSCPVLILDYYAIIKEEINYIGMEDG